MLIACSSRRKLIQYFQWYRTGCKFLSVIIAELRSAALLRCLQFPRHGRIHPHRETNPSEYRYKLTGRSLIVQNLLLMLLPIIMQLVKILSAKAESIEHKFFLNRFPTSVAWFSSYSITPLSFEFRPVELCISNRPFLARNGGGVLLSKSMCLNQKNNTHLIIEIGMQNAACLAHCCSNAPPVFSINGIIAIPAIIYALMNGCYYWDM